MKKSFIYAASVVLSIGMLIACDSKFTSCVGCQKLTCDDKQVDSWCRVEITDPRAYCHFEQSFGYCLTLPKGGFPPNTDINNWVWQIFPTLIRPLISETYGSYVGFELRECRVAATNPFLGATNTNSYMGVLGKVALENPDGGIKVEDEAACEVCASAACNLTSCGADANCSCWVVCASLDASLVSCPASCGAAGDVTTTLASCLVTSCGAACGVADTTKTCSSIPNSGTGGTGTSSCGQSGDPCGNAGDLPCCDALCMDTGSCM